MRFTSWIAGAVDVLVVFVARVQVLVFHELMMMRVRLRSSDALDAGVIASPHINNTGATTPPAAIAPASHGQSFLVRDASCAPEVFIRD